MEGQSKKSDYELRTRGGYDLMLVRSALQKSLRYGLEEEAIYWAQEMQDYTQYLLVTLATVNSEDIAWVNPAMSAAIDAKIQLWLIIQHQKKKKATYGPALAAVILMMCRSRKSRVADSAWEYVRLKREAGWRLEIPDWAKDEHNDEGRALNRWWRFFVRISSRLSNRARPDELMGDDYSDKIERVWLRGHPSHPDEPDYEALDPAEPYKPIITKHYTPDKDSNG
ncbi:MAG: hypothetical protein AB7G93_11320 [Bdellovibrionales bacterium]